MSPLGSDIVKYSGLQLAGQQVAQAGKSLGWIMVILGILHYFIKISFPTLAVYSLVFSMSLFILAAYALAQRTSKDKLAILIPMLIFCVWYFIFSGDLSLTFWLWFAPTVFALVALPIFLTKGKSVTPEVLGLLPVLFFFLDVGLLPWLVDRFSIIPTIFLENLMLFMPWWAFFGVMTMPTDNASKGYTNFLINLTRILGVVFIIFTFVVPAIPDLGHESSFTNDLPGIGELNQAAEKYQERAAKTEHPFVSNIACIVAGEYDDIPACVEKRVKKREFEAYCRFEENIKKGTSKFKSCVEEQEKKREKELLVAGRNDQNIKEPTEASFKVSDFFPETQFVATIDDSLNFHYPINFILKNPREQPLHMIFSCNFTASSKKKKNVPGKIEGQALIKAQGSETKTTVVCSPTAPLDGKYELVYTADMQGITTESTLKRAFIGDKDIFWKEEWLPKIKEASFGRSGHLSKGPDEFARINFAFGNFLEDPIVEYKAGQTNIIVSSTVENLGRGKITKLHNYELALNGFFSESTQSDCLGGVDVKLSKTKQKTIPLPTCLISQIPDELQNPEDFVIREFIASITYDYQVTRKLDVQVKKLEGFEETKTEPIANT
jgi:hypothetical protein